MGLAAVKNLATPRGSYFADLDPDVRAHAGSLAREAHNGHAPSYAPDPQALFVIGEGMKRAARHAGSTVALLVLELPDLPELEIVFGREAATRAVSAAMGVLSRLAGSKGFAVRTSGSIFALLMPDVTGNTLERALRHRLGSAACVEFAIDDEEIVLVPQVQACTVGNGDSIARTYRVLCRSIGPDMQSGPAAPGPARSMRDVHGTAMEPRPCAMKSAPPGPPWRTPASCATIPATILMPLGGK